MSSHPLSQFCPFCLEKFAFYPLIFSLFKYSGFITAALIYRCLGPPKAFVGSSEKAGILAQFQPKILNFLLLCSVFPCPPPFPLLLVVSSAFTVLCHSICSRAQQIRPQKPIFRPVFTHFRPSNPTVAGEKIFSTSTVWVWRFLATLSQLRHFSLAYF